VIVGLLPVFKKLKHLEILN